MVQLPHGALSVTLSRQARLAIAVVAAALLVACGGKESTTPPEVEIDPVTSLPQFGVCREVTGYFNHVAALNASISARLPAFDQQCFT